MPPKCAACIHSAAHKQPWQKWAQASNVHISSITSPSQCISINQIISQEPGFVAQLKGWLTTSRYRVVMVFMDRFSCLRCINLQKCYIIQDTQSQKRPSKHTVASIAIQIFHYHCDNGQFAAKTFLLDVSAKNQSISFCGVNAYFQNGIAEMAVCILHDHLRKLFLHAHARWPQAIHTLLWPYAWRTACHMSNIFHINLEGKSRLKKIFGVNVSPSLKYQHTFWCPVYSLDSSLAAGKSIPKWDSCARLGVYLGPSLRHACSEVLVLHQNPGFVSLQFHVTFDDFFETTCFNHAETLLPSAWQKHDEFILEDRYWGQPKLHEKADKYGSWEKQVEHSTNTNPGEQGLEEPDVGQYLPNDAEFVPADIYEELHQCSEGNIQD